MLFKLDSILLTITSQIGSHLRRDQRCHPWQHQRHDTRHDLGQHIDATFLKDVGCILGNIVFNVMRRYTPPSRLFCPSPEA